MMKRSMLLLLTLLGGAAAVQAQSMPMYGNGAYPPPASANPYGYYGNPQYYAQPAQPVQYPYGYGANPNNGYPPAAYGPRPYYAPNNYGYQNGYGVNYYYMQNPIGPSPTPAPYSAVANQRALEATPASYPAPPAGAPGIYQAAPLTGDDGMPGADLAKPPIVFHRKPCETFWISADYLGTIITPMRIPVPLVSTGSPGVPNPGVPGRDPSASVLFGDNSVNFNIFSGMKAEMGIFLDKHDTFSLDWSGFYLPGITQTASFAGDATGNPVLTRPIFNIATGQEGGFVNSLPPTNGNGGVTGSINITTRSELAGTEFNARIHAYLFERLHVDALVGFRYARLAESLHIQEQISDITPGFLTFQTNPIAMGNILADRDFFDTTNQFFGPQIGAHMRYEEKWFNLDGFAKVAAGANYQRVDIAGNTSVLSPTGVQVANAAGGILALPSNIGTYSRTVFGMMPEFGIGIGVNLTEHVQLHLGYSLLLWSHVVRPGGQISDAINPGLVPGNPTFGTINGPTGPTQRFNDEFFWAHNFNFGIEMRF